MFENDIIIDNKVVYMKEKLSYYNMFWLFIFGSVIGWCLEVIFTFITQGQFINHSALVIGPFDVAYGICACALTLLLYRFKDYDYIKLFAIGFIGGSVLEYIMSWGMELVLGFVAWDYSGLFLNINGRICFIMSVIWGFLGIVWIKYAYPVIEKIIGKMNPKIGRKLMIFLSIFLLLDAGLTISAIYRAKEKDKGVEARNKYEELLDKTFNKEYLTNMFCNNWSE